MTKLRLFVLAAAAAPALLLGACKKGSGDTAVGGGAAAAGPAIPAPPGGWVGQVRRTAVGGYLMGNPDAPVKVVEYGSRTCPHCAAFAKEGYAELKSDYIPTGRVSYEFRDYAIHAPDMAAILLGECGSPQAFFPILEQMFANQPAVFAKLENLPQGFEQQFAGKSAAQQAQVWGDYLGYVSFVGQRGIPQAKARACLSDETAIENYAKALAAANQRYGITGTPTFLINDEVQQQVVAWSQLEPKIQTALGG